MEKRKVTTIPATLNRFTAVPVNSKKKRRVAGYARVSTDHEEQLTSYEAQVDYYTNYIKSRPDWEFAGIYTDVFHRCLIQSDYLNTSKIRLLQAILECIHEQMNPTE